MRIPARYAPILFSALLSAIMVCVVSAFVLMTTQGLHPGLVAQWLGSCARSIVSKVMLAVLRRWL